MITFLNTVTVYVRDQQRSVDFYVDVLGFHKRADRDMGPAGRWIEVCPSGARTGLVLVRGDAFDRHDRVGHSADLVFETDDVHATHEELAARGADVTEPYVQAWGTSVQVTDPDGMTILIKQTR